MSEAYEYAAYLAQEIGPRPAGTKEEQQASFYIEEVFKNDALLNTSVHEFSCNVNSDLPKTICCIATIVFTLIAIFVNFLSIPAFLICVVAAVISVLLDLGKIDAVKFNKHGISQNVIAKYMPQFNTKGISSSGSRSVKKRKIVVLANYDTNKVDKSLNSAILPNYKYINLAEICAVVVLAVLGLLRIFLNTGGVAVFFNVIAVIACIITFLPVLKFVLNKSSSFDPGANCNAAGVAVMLDVAKNISNPIAVVRETTPVTHGEDVINDSGYLPPETDVEYINEPRNKEFIASAPLIIGGEGATALNTATDAVENDDFIIDNDEKLSAVQQQQMNSFNSDDVIEDVANIEEESNIDALQEIIKGPEFIEEKIPEVPDWYKKAISKANRDIYSEAPVKRSKYGDALSAAEKISANAIEKEFELPDASAVLTPVIESAVLDVTQVIETPVSESAPKTEGVGGFLAHTMHQGSYVADSVVYGVDVVKSEQAPADTDVASPVEDKQSFDAEVAQRTVSFIPVATNLDESSVLNDLQVPKLEDIDSSKKRRNIALPSLTGAIEGLTGSLQAAPLESEETRRESLNEERIETRIQNLETALPSIKSNIENNDERTISISTAGSFASAEVTSAFTPVDASLVQDMPEDEIYIDDADDSDYATQFTEYGAPTGPGYVDMPKSRAPKFFDRFRRKKKEEEISLSEVIGVDESFDARSVGAKRGSWESFKQDDFDADASAFNDSDSDWDDEWDGGAFSLKDKISKGSSMVSDSKNRVVKGVKTEGRSERTASVKHREYTNPFAGIELSGNFSEEREEISQIADGLVNNEVWFVALGASYADNAGMKELLDANKEELKGAMFINLTALGAGETGLIQNEGRITPKTASSRLKRYANKAASALGFRLSSTSVFWRDTASYIAAKEGHQAIHICGIENGKPAYFGQSDDTIDNVNPDILSINSSLVMDVIRAI